MNIYQIMTMSEKMIKKQYLNVVYGKRENLEEGERVAEWVK